MSIQQATVAPAGWHEHKGLQALEMMSIVPMAVPMGSCCQAAVT